MRVLVCGGRDYSDTRHVFKTLSDYRDVYPVDVIIEGDARGADRIAGYWARKNKIDNLKFPADWKSYGKAAGHIRNRRMLEEGKPDVVIAFPGGRGTANMVMQAQAAGITVYEIPTTDTPPPRKTCD